MALALVRLIPSDTAIPFIKQRFIAFGFSVVLLIASITAFFTMGLNFGIDFRGGTDIEIRLQEEADVAEIRDLLSIYDFTDVRVQRFGDPQEVLIQVGEVDLADAMTLPGAEADMDDAEAQQVIREAVQATLLEAYPDLEFRRLGVVSPQVSDELIVAGATAVIGALVLMLLYIWFRFEWQYSVGAVLALTHDVIATVGFFAVTQLEFNLSTIAAILTIVGYSMNDTVVVYDRIREKFRKFKTEPTEVVLNRAINKTLSRTMLTSGTTLVALVAMALIGGAALQGFSLALIWGIVIGTYSSVFVAAPLLTLTGVKRSSDEDEE